MLERRMPTRETAGPGHGSQDDIFLASASTTAIVSHGHYSEELPVGGMNVGEIRARYRDRFDIDPRSQAVLDGNEVDNNTVVRPGQILIFSRKAGEKGCALSNETR
jgi:hypothetical protein